MTSLEPQIPEPSLEDRAYLSTYDPRCYPAFAVTVDLVVFTMDRGRFSALLVERGTPPFRGCWALPGGFVREGEDTTAAAWRELAEETGIVRKDFTGHLEQLRTYSEPDRDPRMRVISVVHLALSPALPTPVAGTDSLRAQWWPVADLHLPGLRQPPRPRGASSPTRASSPGHASTQDTAVVAPALAFDHARILADAVERVAAKLEYTSVATSLVSQEFTLGELQTVYEEIWGVPLDRNNFRRKLKETRGLIEPVTDATPRLTRGRGRPASLYRAGDSTMLHPPMSRPEGARVRGPLDGAGS